MMRKVLLMLFVLMSFNAFSQLQVKEGSFKRDGNAVIDDKDEHYDDNYEPMALIKISTVNINEAERMRLAFKGNRATQIKKEYLNGQVWLYISKAADFLEISHPDYSLITYKLPETLCGFCVYDMTLEYVEPKPGTGFLAISSEPSEADVYVDGKHYGKTTTVVTDLAEGNHTLKLEKQGYLTVTKNIVITKGETFKLNETLQTVSSQKTYLIVKADQPDARIYIDDNLKNTGEHAESVIIGSTHTYKIECNLYHTETGTVTVNERMTIEKKLRPAFGYINVSTSPEQGAKVFVNGEYLGLSPIKSDKLKSGSHTVMVMKDMFKMTEKSFTVNDGQTTNATLNMSANFVNVTINTDADADIYVDDDYKAKGRWTGRLSDGLHNFEARKANHRSTKKSFDLVLGEKQTITLEAPKPISGSLDVNTSPMSAEIYIDCKHYGQTPNFINDVLIGTHELKLEKSGCATLTKTITIKENETLTINEKLQTGKEITISTDQSGDAIYVDGNYVGTSPITSNLSYGSHNIKAVRNDKEVSKTISVSQSGGENNVKLAFVQEINGHEYVDLGLSVKWATCNVGANKPEDYGDYFAWGETSTKSSYTSDNSKTYGKQMNDIKGNSQYDAARANWGGSWRLPTKKELEELENKCTWTWTTQNGVKGYKVTGPNGNSIFLPAAGYRNGSSLNHAGEYGDYWSSTPNESIDINAYYLDFGSSYQRVKWFYRGYGRSVRPVIYIVSVNNETITVNGVSFTMIKVEGGTFSMGATSEQGGDAYRDEKPVHSVTLSDYYIGETEVTQELWQAVMGSNPSYSKGSQKPVEKVSWNDCKEFITKLNRLTGKNFRLPTEAEWEYAARGGNKSIGYKYSGSNTIGNVAWYDGNSGKATHNVKTKSPNELGIYDMSGNVWEWCEDWYGNYSSGSQTNPTGPSTGFRRVFRGGSFSTNAKNCRVSNRFNDTAGDRRSNYGFRLAL